MTFANQLALEANLVKSCNILHSILLNRAKFHGFFYSIDMCITVGGLHDSDSVCVEDNEVSMRKMVRRYTKLTIGPKGNVGDGTLGMGGRGTMKNERRMPIP